jgi:iron complex outermembrane recepter protein
VVFEIERSLYPLNQFAGGIFSMSLFSKPFVRLALVAALAFPVAACLVPIAAHAQTDTSLAGSVLDPKGVLLPGAAVSVKNEATGATQKTTSDAQGKYAFHGLTAGTYTVQVDAPGFSTSRKTGVQVAAGSAAEVSTTLELGNISEQVTVEANGSGSIAAAMAPMDALLEETSARTEITQAFINNFTSPVADYGEVVAMAPSTFTLNGNGVGLGQSKT